MRRIFTFVIAVALAGCSQRSPAPAPPTSAPLDAPRPVPADRDCNGDHDCVLMPLVTCCGECAPAPPFEVATRVHLDGVLVESETQCARDRRPCEPPVCTPLPHGCEAAAACVDGRCVVQQHGC